MPLLDRMKRETAIGFHPELTLDNFSQDDCDPAALATASVFTIREKGSVRPD